MRSVYTELPKRIEIHTHSLGTDVVLRANLEETKDPETSQTLYECDEKQGQIDYSVTEDEIVDNFDYWWEYLDDIPEPKRQTEAERLAQLRADVDYIAIMTGIELEA